ncbi:hypothetical protein TpMuguga_01g00257 [Theileria parva strain Muguga]|uniref:Uncharacterized protein n=1 Tax=Theileria parva TaxID=5875 RepID=Q4N957_THEPA|nr:uncharacterized protein TpMuguga_01g00257 [Theileria parva strain Muguga]EAN33501.1 hypothetical protein TpMuguga_01g00257 [Theileria parva strain Muguga]|eukprot:XP_765784.1 hypothetical protein [Theileria parva strain Muguga]
MRTSYLFRYYFIYLLLNNGKWFVISADNEPSKAKGSSQSTNPVQASSTTSSSVTVPSDVGLFTTDASGKKVKLDDSQFKTVQEGVEYSFEPDSGVQLTEVRHGSTTVWEHKSGEPYPKSVSYKSDDKQFAILFDGRVFMFRFQNNEWKSELDSLSPDPTKAEGKPAVTGVELDLKATAGSNQFEYKRSGDTATFTAKTGHEFTTVMETTGTGGSRTVTWRSANPNENATKVELEGVGKNDQKLTIHKKNDSKLKFNKSGANANWEEVVTKVELDLGKTSATDQFDYDRKNEFATYFARDGYGFNKVLKAKATDYSREELVWAAEASSKNFVKLVRVKLTDNHVALLLNNLELLLYHKTAEDQPWKDITSDRHKLSELKFFTFDQSGSPKEIDSTYYRVELNGFSYGYTFHDDFEFHQIKYQNKLVYDYDADEDFGLLKGVYLGLSSNNFFITNYDNESKKLDVTKEVVLKKAVPITATAVTPTVKPKKPKKVKAPEEAAEAPPEPTPAAPETENTIEPVSVTIPKATLVELKIDKSDSTNEFEYHDIGVYKTFSCKQGFGFNKVVRSKTFGADVLWEAPANDYATKVRVKETAGTKEKHLLLFLASQNYVFFHSDKGKPFENVTDKRHKFFNLKVFSVDESSKVEKTLKPDQYTISLYHMSIGCTIKSEHVCSKITYEGKEVYKKDNYQDLGNIKGVYLDLIRNSMYVIGVNDETKVLEAMKKAKAIVLDINKTDSTEDFDFTQDYQKNIKTHAARGNAVFAAVVKGSRITGVAADEIWKSSSPNVALERTKNVTVHLSNGDVKHLNYSDGKWGSVSNKISLDITKTQSSIEFDYFLKDDFTTFTAKDSFVFNKVFESKTLGADTDIWKATNPSEYSTKACLMVTGSEKYLGLFRTDGNVILLHRPPGKDWENATSKIPKVSDLKMLYYDAGSYMQLKPDKYKLTFDNLMYGYEFNHGVDCHLVKFGDKHLWNHSDDPNFKTIKGVYLYLRSGQFIVVSPSDQRKEISLRGLTEGKEGEEEEEEEGGEEGKEEGKEEEEEEPKSSAPATLVELDVEKKESTEQYGYEKKDDDHVFKAKSGFKFSKVKKGTHVLKDLPDPHSPRVVANYGQVGKILLYVYKNNKDFEFSLVDDPDPTSEGPAVPSGSATGLAESKIVSEQFKLLTQDDSGSSREIDKEQLKSKEQILSHLINYTFPEKAKCSELTYGNKSIWKHDKSIHGNYYPSNVILNTNTSFLMVESQGQYQYYFTLMGDEWKCISGYKSHILQPLSLFKLKMFTLNEFSLINTDDATQYNKKVDGNVTTFKFKPGAKCIGVKYGGDSVWSYNDTDHEDHYPDTIIVNTNQNFLSLECSNLYRYVFSYYDGKFACIFAYKSRLSHPIEQEKLRLSKVGDLGLMTPADTSDFELKESDTTYKFESGLRFASIKYDGDEVWKYDETKYKGKFPTSLSFNKINRNYLALEWPGTYRQLFQFQNNKLTSLRSGDRVNYFYDVTGVFDLDKLKLYTQDDSSNLVELDLNQYSVEQPTLITYNFKDSVKCGEVRYDDLLVWKYDHSEHGDVFPTAVVLNKAKNYIFVESSYFYRHVLSYYNRQWKELPFGFKTSNLFFHKFKMFTEDTSDPNKLVELDSSKYEPLYSSNALTINFNSDVKCTHIRYGDEDPWKHDSDEHRDKFPTSLVLNKKKKLLIVESGYDYRYVYSRQNNMWKLLPYGYKLSESSKTRPSDPNNLKLFTTDTNKKLAEIDESKYEKKDSENLFQIKFNPDANCKVIKYDDVNVWSYDLDDHKDRHPTSLVLNKKKNYIMVESGHDYSYSYAYYNRKWNLLPVSYNHRRSSDPIDHDKLKFFKLNENRIPEETTFGKEGDDSLTIYKIPADVKCVGVKYDGVEVWRHNGDEHQDKYPTRVLLYKNNSTLMVESSSNYEYVFTYEDKVWKLVPFGARLKVTESRYNLEKLKLCSFDHTNKTFDLENLNHYSLQGSRNLARFTFNQGVKCTEVRYDGKLVWKYHYDEHEGHFPTEVTVNLNTGFITVESKAHYETYFSYYDDKWNLVYGYKASTRTKFRESAKLRFYITNEDGLLEPTISYDEVVTGPVITYNIYYGVKCTHVKFDEVSVWTYDSDKYGDHYPTSVVFNVTKMVITVQSSDQYVHFSSLVGQEWRPFSGFVSSKTTGPSEVKIYKIGRSGDQVLVHSSKYTVTWDSVSEYVYDLKDANCNEIRHNGTAVFKLDPKERYPKEVSYSSQNKKFVVKLRDSYHVCTMDREGWKSMIHKMDGSNPVAGPKYPFDTARSTPSVLTTAPTSESTHASDSSQLRGTSGELNLADALGPSSSSEGSTPTPKPGTSTTSTTGQAKDFDLADAVESSQTSKGSAASPKEQPSSTTSTPPSGSETFME